MRPGDIVKLKNSQEKDRYMFLGYLHSKDADLGWFTPFPLHPVRPGYESEIPIYLWFMALVIK